MRLSEIENLINNYVSNGGEIHTIEEGVLGYGLTVLTGDGLYTFVIREKYLNCYSSTHTIRKYKEIPKKYQEMIDEL